MPFCFALFGLNDLELRFSGFPCVLIVFTVLVLDTEGRRSVGVGGSLSFVAFVEGVKS